MAGRASIEVREPIPGLKRAGRLFRDYYGFDIVMPANFRAVEIVLKSCFDPWYMSGVRGKAFRPAKNSVYTNPAKVSMLVPCHELGKMPLQHKNLENRNNFFAKKRQLFSGISRAYPLKTLYAWSWARPCSGGRGKNKRSESFRSLRGPTSGSPLDRSTSGNQLSKRAAVTVVYWHFKRML